MIDLAPEIWAFALAVTVFAGFVKGVVGFAMPLVMLSGLTFVLDPRLAVAALIIPIVVSNGFQTFRAGLAPALDAAREFWRYLLIVVLAILVFAQLVPLIDPQTFYLVLGVPVVLIALMQLVGFRMTIPPERRWWAEWVVGLVSGVLGGMAGTWGPTTVLYLLAIDTPKAKQIVVQGIIYGTGAITLFVAHLASGILNSQTAPFSALLVPAGLIGMWIGFRVQDRLDQARFRKIVLSVLLIAGLNLVRRGLFG